MSATHIAISLPEEYPYIMGVVTAIAFHCMFIGFSIGGARRKTLFNKEFMAQFEVEHNRELKQNIPTGGYPDMGNGWYCNKLSYKDWFLFNVDQRIHKNYLESLTIVCSCLLIAGLCYGRMTLILSIVYFLARFAYAAGYQSSPEARAYGGAIQFMSTFVIFGTAAMSCFNMIMKTRALTGAEATMKTAEM